MKKSILVELLSRFNSKEMKEFGEYVHSPFFNKNEGVIKLFEYIRKQHPDYSDKCVEKKYAYSKIFPDVEYNDGFMRTLMFNLTELAEGYLAFTKYKDFEFTEKKYLLVRLNEKELDRHIEKKMKEISKEFDTVQALDADFYINKFMIGWEYLFYLTRSNLDKLEKFINRKDAEDIFNSLTYFYLFSAIKHYLYTIIIRNEYSIEFKTGLIENIFKYLDPKDIKDAPVLTLYYNILTLFLEENNITSFQDVKEQINSLGSKLNKLTLRNIYTYLIHFCKDNIRKGRTEFVKELFGIYRIMLEKKIYALQREMSPKFYKGVTDTAIRLKEYDWAKEFIEKYKKELPENKQADSYFYCLSLIEFALNNYETSLELLRKVKYTEVYQKLDLRCLIAELYYELDYDVMLISHLDSFRHFLSNDKIIPNERKKYYSNFINFIKYLNAVKCKDNKHLLKHLKQKTAGETSLYNKEWLLEKIDQLRD